MEYCKQLFDSSWILHFLSDSNIKMKNCNDEKRQKKAWKLVEININLIILVREKQKQSNIMVLKRQEQARDYYRNSSEEENEKKNDQKWIN